MQLVNVCEVTWNRKHAGVMAVRKLQPRLERAAYGACQGSDGTQAWHERSPTSRLSFATYTQPEGTSNNRPHGCCGRPNGANGPPGKPGTPGAAAAGTCGRAARPTRAASRPPLRPRSAQPHP